MSVPTTSVNAPIRSEQTTADLKAFGHCINYELEKLLPELDPKVDEVDLLLEPAKYRRVLVFRVYITLPEGRCMFTTCHLSSELLSFEVTSEYAAEFIVGEIHEYLWSEKRGKGVMG